MVLSTNSKSLSPSAKRKMPAVVLVAEDVPMDHLVMAAPTFVHFGAIVSRSVWSSPSALEHQAQGWDTWRKGWDSGQGSISLAQTQSLGCAKASPVATIAKTAKAGKNLRFMLIVPLVDGVRRKGRGKGASDCQHAISEAPRIHKPACCAR